MKNKIKIIMLVLLLSILAGVLYLNFFKNGMKQELKEEVSTIPDTGEKIQAELYFSSIDGMFLVPENREVKKSDEINNQIKIVLLELINGPKDANLVPTIPYGTNINEVYIDQQNTAYIDFTNEIKENHPGGSTGELLTVYSIVNTITSNFHNVKKVQILINQDTVDSLTGHIDISMPIQEDKSIIQVLQKW